MRKHYLISYSGRNIEGVKRFYSKSRFNNFLQRIPDWELKNTASMYFDGKFYWVGMYHVLKRGGLRARFK